ncbi:MAG TPA: HAMP domain-containing sensor histidine kinase [Pseudonocardiaceae bacterium]|jgi:two-component system OmpR family sensor kinase|nr:HAMP domain-containing sensor histidine kinase [Pseudonocardiaceae bacterium]
MTATMTRPFRTLWAAARRQPLRVQLVAALMTLLAAVLIGSYFVASATMQNYLLHQVDLRLARTTAQIERGIAAAAQGGGGVPGRFFGGRPQIQDAYQAQLRVDGQTEWIGQAPAKGAATPQLPASPLLGSPFTVPSAGTGANWRVLATALPTTPGSGSAVILVATDQGEVDAAIGDLSRLYLWISVGALVLLGGLGYALVRSSLKPLEEVERTAEVIATGDLSRRVPVRRQGSEVGRLANAFNTMVERFESAFRARQRSEALARSSEERMRRFVADASHELRTPLTSIRGYAELYRQGAVTSPADVASVLHRIEDQAARMGLLVDELLLLARLDEQRPFEHARVDLAVLTVDAVHDAHAVAPDRSVGLRLPPAIGEEPAEVPVLGDEARLRQVLGNLVNNALIHTPQGTPVEVRVRPEAGEAVVEVADKGPGLPLDAAERVFERFYRADPARGRANGGTGLGLAIVAAIVAAHGGRVEVQTAVGVGTTFRVRLPLASQRIGDGVEQPRLPVA